MYEILFVEDDTSISFLISRYKLWQEGNFHISDVAKHGREAWELLQQKTYDLVIMDIRMPVMDGMELLEKMRKEGNVTDVILASTYNDFQYAKKGIQYGVLDFLEKPYTEQKLRESLRHFLSHHKAVERIPVVIKEKALETLLRESRRMEVTEFLQIDWEGMGQEKAREAAKELLEYLWSGLCAHAPWLNYLEQMDIYLGENVAADMELVLQEYQKVAEKYRLWELERVASQAAKLMEEHITEEKMTDFLADQLHLSGDYIARIFKNRVGMTILEYCTVVKMERAKEMFKSTSKKVYEISEELGYTTTDYFTRLFKKYTGYTPLQYKKNV